MYAIKARAKSSFIILLLSPDANQMTRFIIRSMQLDQEPAQVQLQHGGSWLFMSLEESDFGDVVVFRGLQ